MATIRPTLKLLTNGFVITPSVAYVFPRQKTFHFRRASRYFPPGRVCTTRVRVFCRPVNPSSCEAIKSLCWGQPGTLISDWKYVSPLMMKRMGDTRMALQFFFKRDRRFWSILCPYDQVVLNENNVSFCLLSAVSIRMNSRQKAEEVADWRIFICL